MLFCLTTFEHIDPHSSVIATCFKHMHFFHEMFYFVYITTDIYRYFIGCVKKWEEKMEKESHLRNKKNVYDNINNNIIINSTTTTTTTTTTNNSNNNSYNNKCVNVK